MTTLAVDLRTPFQAVRSLTERLAGLLTPEDQMTAQLSIGDYALSLSTMPTR